MTSQKHSYPILDSRFSILDEHRVSGIEHRVCRAQQKGLTLIELLVSIAITTILMLTIGSAMLIATQAMPDVNGAANTIIVASAVVEQLATELQYAITINDSNATMIEFTVADRDANGVPETIRYAWSGTPGDPLTRQYNAGTAVTIAEDVQEFSLTYNVRSVTEQPPPENNESPEMVLASHETPSSPLDFAITENNWIGQYFHPSLSPDATEWRVTRVRFQARIRGAAKGITAVQLRLSTASNLPGAAVLEEFLMDESNLDTSYLWEEFSFSSVSGLSSSQGLCLVLACQKKDADLADVQYDDGGGTDRLTTSNGGSSWSSDTSKSMIYTVYGTVTTTTQPDPITREWMRSVGLKVRVGADPSTLVQTATQVLNAPEVTP